MLAIARKTSEKIWIPELDPTELARRVAGIRPIMSIGEAKHYIAPVDPEKESFLFNPKRGDLALLLRPVENILTYHRYNKYDSFTPSIAEVLANIPTNLIGYVVAFEVIRHLNAPIDLREHREAIEAGYHVAHTRLYRHA